MKKILSAIMAAVIAVSALCVGASAAETATPSGVGFSEIGKKIEAFAAENEGKTGMGIKQIYQSVDNDDAKEHPPGIFRRTIFFIHIITVIQTHKNLQYS